MKQTHFIPLLFGLIFFTLTMTTACNIQNKEKKETFHTLTILHNSSWEFESDDTSTRSCKLRKDDAMIEVDYKEAAIFSNPYDEFNRTTSFVKDFSNFKIITKPHHVTENDSDYYECVYQFGVQDSLNYISQWFIRDEYISYEITYSGHKESYDKYLEEAKHILTKMSIESKKEVSADVALDVVKGEYDGEESGYLILKDDFTYEWYKDSSLDKSNVHTGSFKCDNKVKALDVKEDEGYYLAITPEQFIQNSEKVDSAANQLNFGLIFNTDNSVRFIDLNTNKLYKFKKLK